jgi:bifunctional ADP-heptose synthase (sugar kinase/adenylyltransferase)
MDQVDVEETGVITSQVLQRLGQIQQKHPEKLIIADSRRGLKDYPNLTYKMNANELATWKGHQSMSLDQIKEESLKIARESGQPVFVSMADQGITGTEPTGNQAHAPSLPLRGPIDIVGAGDSVTANLSASLAAGASIEESLQLSMRAASCVIHQLGTTGTATRNDLKQLV